MFGNITLKCRPLRLAFLIPPDKAALRNAIQINSTLWGGTYNPIIPLYARPLKAWKNYPGQKISMKDRVAGYVRAFDPDILVDCTGSQLPAYLAELDRSTIPVDEIWSDFFSEQRDRTPKYGVGVFELLHGIFKEHFEVVRRFPSKVAFPVFPKEHTLFWAASVGELPEAIQEDVEMVFSEALGIEKPTIGPQNYDPILQSCRFIPRNITRYQLETDGIGSRRSYAFHMDATKFADIVDYWNLRALGRLVVPIPKQFVDVPEYLTHIRNYVQNQYRVDRYNPSVTYGTTVIRSYSSTMSELESLANALDLKTLFPDMPDARPLLLQHWYPRIWDEWAMGRDHAAPADVFSSTTEYSFPEVRDTASFDFVMPKFITIDVSNDTPRYANEIYPRFYGHGEDVLADVLPYDHGDEVLRAAGGIFNSRRDEFRISRTGAVHLVKWRHGTRWKLPLAEDIFFAWLKDKGFDAELSTCGRLAKQMHAQLGAWLGVLTNEPLLKLFDMMAKGGEDGKGAPLGEVKSRIKNIGSRNKGLYQSLVERNVFQLGYKTQCRHCGRTSWFSVNDLAAELSCPLCFKKLDAISAVDKDNKGEWHLKTAGPFSVDKFGDGSYSVLLTLNFLQKDHSLQTTPVMSFKAKHATSGKELEADLGVIWQNVVYGEHEDGIFFAECKSYNEFEAKDFERMRTLAEQFPGAILAFCTLRKTLSPREVKEIIKITKAGMKLWKTERPINPVLVLTGHELFSLSGVPYCWKGMSIPGWAERTHTLLATCNATQAIHLGMPHWQEVWSAEVKKKLRRKDKRKLGRG